jgi:hypothetical protein
MIQAPDHPVYSDRYENKIRNYCFHLQQLGENLVGRALHLLLELSVKLLLQLLFGERQLDLLLLVLFEDEHLRRQSCQFFFLVKRVPG